MPPCSVVADGSHVFVTLPDPGVILKVCCWRIEACTRTSEPSLLPPPCSHAPIHTVNRVHAPSSFPSQIGSGYCDTRIGAVIASRQLADIFPALASAAKLAATSVRLVLLSGSLLLVASPDPETGVGVALRRLDRIDLSESGSVAAPFHGGALIEDADAAAGPSAAVSLLLGDAAAPVAASAKDSFLVFSGADGMLYTLSRAPAAAEDLSFGRLPANRYHSGPAAPATPAESKPTLGPALGFAAEIKSAASKMQAAKEEKKKKRASATAAAAAAVATPAPAASSKPAAPDAPLPYPDGVIADAARPAGATKCILRSYSLPGAAAAAGSTFSLRGGGVGSAAAQPARLKLESTKTLWVPPTSADCELGAAARPAWAPQPLPAAAAAAASPASALWMPPVQADAGLPSAPLRSVVSNGSTTVAVTVAGEAYYIGDGKVIGAGPSAVWAPFEAVPNLVQVRRGESRATQRCSILTSKL
jgi:hypothetical protein